MKRYKALWAFLVFNLVMICSLSLLAGCNLDKPITGSPMWSCDVVIEIFLVLRSDASLPGSRVDYATGSGNGVTQQEAHRKALESACNSLRLPGEEETKCKQDLDFNPIVGNKISKSFSCKQG